MLQLCGWAFLIVSVTMQATGAATASTPYSLSWNNYFLRGEDSRPARYIAARLWEGVWSRTPWTDINGYSSNNFPTNGNDRWSWSDWLCFGPAEWLVTGTAGANSFTERWSLDNNSYDFHSFETRDWPQSAEKAWRYAGWGNTPPSYSPPRSQNHFQYKLVELYVPGRNSAPSLVDRCRNDKHASSIRWSQTGGVNDEAYSDYNADGQHTATLTRIGNYIGLVTNEGNADFANKVGFFSFGPKNWQIKGCVYTSAADKATCPADTTGTPL